MFSIKIIFVILATTISMSSCFPEPAKGSEQKCLDDNGITGEEFEEHSPLFMKNSIDVDIKYRNFAKCLLNAFTLLREDGSFDIDKFTDTPKQNHREIVIEVTNGCIKEHEGNIGENDYSFDILSCIIQGIDKRRKEENIQEHILKPF